MVDSPVPQTLADIERMIRSQQQESVHLDYKAGRAINLKARDDIAKDVSAFANAAGGLLIYGVEEKDHLPVRIDEGVADAECSREWIEAAILTGITPRVDGVRIVPLPVQQGRSVYVIEVPQSFRGPHQAADKRYYKRHNFKSVPMEDYEVADVRNRRRHIPALVSFEVRTYGTIVAVFEIENVGEMVAQDVRFEFSKVLPWPTQAGMPRPLATGIKNLAPRQRLRFLYFPFPEIIGEEGQVPAEFSVTISYHHPGVGHRVSDVWDIDFAGFQDSLYIRSDVEEQGEAVVKSLRSLEAEMKRVREKLDELARVSGPTGLALSVSTLRNLKRVLREGKEVEPIHPQGQPSSVFREVLGVDRDMGVKLHAALGIHYDPERLSQVPGMTDALMQKIRTMFVVQPAD